MHGCKFELIVRIPKLYSCIFQADFPSLRAVGACEPLLEKQNITKQKTLCGVRASQLLRCSKFVQVWLIFTNHSDRPVVLGVVNGFISLKAGIGVPRIGTFLSSDSAYDSAAYSIEITTGINQSQVSVPSTVACCERLIWSVASPYKCNNLVVFPTDFVSDGVVSGIGLLFH